ncbi:MAG: GTPase-associated system all-helical protein GASH [Syntrophobacteraceae bacterium]
MHEKFADWLRPISFGHDRQMWELRWQGIEAAIKGLDFSAALELVRLVFGRPLVSTESLDKFRQNFKSFDPAFPSSGNDYELQALAGCVLANICTDEANEDNEVPLAIKTASACGKRVPKVEIDLVGMATERVRQDGIKARSRSSIPEVMAFTHKNAFDSAVSEFDNNQAQGMPSAVNALKKIVSALESLLSSVQNETKKSVTQISKLLRIQDEELQVLWWMVGGLSGMWNLSFVNIESKARPILLAKEAAGLTDLPSEPPSLKSVFYRLGIEASNQITIPDAVNACGGHLKALAPNSMPCPTIFPLHFAISRALETGAGKSWIPGWSKVSEISAKEQIEPLELALQMFREIKLMEISEGSNE